MATHASCALGGRDFSVAYFLDEGRVTAAVAHRFPPPAPVPFREALRRLLTGWSRPPRAPASSAPLPAGWDGAVGQGGPHEVLHSRARRRVRVAGAEFVLPADGTTLVLLVHDDPVRVEARTVPVVSAVVPGAHRALCEALARDPVVRAFLPDGALRVR
ncbi:hypothetical protein [Roseisolibacter sp. H3M3-2]|uniref:hypothetical protein n=1 Tax=Roseisolibacter sp. H3M3-2 TaxID=3031323 RepID=UPI0023DC7C27|nr:hypothetical protein [Roseisolibacter sp. H3M3-2]MDF1501617.1 hypothetical protein [Roseisolibacter sp. H3M3-2]